MAGSETVLKISDGPGTRLIQVHALHLESSFSCRQDRLSHDEGTTHSSAIKNQWVQYLVLPGSFALVQISLVNSICKSEFRNLDTQEADNVMLNTNRRVRIAIDDLSEKTVFE